MSQLDDRAVFELELALDNSFHDLENIQNLLSETGIGVAESSIIYDKLALAIGLVKNSCYALETFKEIRED